MFRKMACFIILGLILAPLAARAEDSAKQKAGETAAERWLGIVDEGNYGESWKEAATLFRQAITQERWEQALQGVRKPLGKLISRQITSRTYTTSLPGAPDGEYVVLKFETSFERKKSAVETVTSTLDKDGQWRVAGYFIK